LGISFVPPPFSTVLNFIGYSGDRDFAHDQLMKAYRDCSLALRRPLVGMILFIYHGVAVHFLGINRKPDREVMKSFVVDLGRSFPANIYQPALEAALLQTQGNFGDSIQKYDATAKHDFFIKRLSVATLAFKLGSLLFLKKWEEAEEAVKFLQEEKWSPAAATYLRGVVLFERMKVAKTEEERLALRKQVCQFLRAVPDLKREIAGQVYHELYILESSKRFMHHPERMVLPVYVSFFLMSHCHSLAYHCLGITGTRCLLQRLLYVRSHQRSRGLYLDRGRSGNKRQRRQI
jgi:hypothetical protein